MRSLLTVLLLPLLSAQEPEPKQPNPALKKLQAELRQAASAVDTAFLIRLRDVGAQRAAVGLGNLTEVVTETTGSFHKDVQLLTIKSKDPVHVLQAGRETIVRVANEPWCLGSKHPKSRVPLRYVADPQRLLRLLGGMQLRIMDRSIDELYGHTCEFLAVSLSREQVRELTFAGVFLDPEERNKSLRDMLTIRGLGTKVAPTVYDLVVAIDVKLRVVRRVRLRAVGAPMDMDRFRNALVGRGGAAPADDEEEEEPESKKAKPAPLKYVKGLPVRQLEGMHVSRLELGLRDHGKVEPPVLDAEQRKLLGR